MNSHGVNVQAMPTATMYASGEAPPLPPPPKPNMLWEDPLISLDAPLDGLASYKVWLDGVWTSAEFFAPGWGAYEMADPGVYTITSIGDGVIYSGESVHSDPLSWP